MFSQNVLLVILNNFTPHKYFVKIKLSCSKGRWSGKISEIDQNDVNKWRHKSKTRHGIKKISVAKCYSGHVKKLYFYKYFEKSSWVVQKGDEVVKLVK